MSRSRPPAATEISAAVRSYRCHRIYLQEIATGARTPIREDVIECLDLLSRPPPIAPVAGEWERWDLPLSSGGSKVRGRGDLSATPSLSGCRILPEQPMALIKRGRKLT